VLGNTTAAGLGVAVAAGGKVAMFSDGTNFRTTDAGSFSGILPVVNGGTGVATSTGTGNTVLSTSPTLVTPILGTPTSGTLNNCTSNTETFGNDTTQLATTAFVQAALAALHPIGSIYTATVATNPATLLGFGTWVAFGAGRVLIGNGGGYAAGATGGSADAVVVSHTHTASSSDSGHTHVEQFNGGSAGIGGGISNSSVSVSPTASSVSTATGNAVITTTITAQGVSGTNANLQPYVVVYMWNRTA